MGGTDTGEARGLALWGASGRMGLELQRLVEQPGSGFALVQAVVSEGSRRVGQSAAQGVAYTPAGPLQPGVEVVVDFSSPGALEALLRQAVEAGRPVVSGTTGLDAERRKRLEEAARQVPVFWAPNFSIGLSALLAAVRTVLPLLEGFEVELVETHHGAKKDAPSGTALKIVETVKQAGPTPRRVLHGRQGVEPRQAGDLGVHALRGGSNPGRHEVHLLGRSEDVVLSHQVWGREVFALGALRAAGWVSSAPPGLYGMEALLSSA